MGQESEGESFSFFNSEENILGEIPRAETQAEVTYWNPDTLTGYISVRYIYPEGYHQIDDQEFFTLKPMSTSGVIYGSAMKAQPIIKDGLLEYFDETIVVLEFRTAPNPPVQELTLDALFQICDENGTCLFPDSEQHQIVFDPTLAPRLISSEVQAVLDWNAKMAEEPLGEIQSTPGPTAETPWHSLLLFLAMAFVGGILLNIMPCVLPLLSVKALNLVKQAGQDRRAILMHSWLYVAGIIASFWVLAGIIIALKASGTLLGWGFQFQSPAFVLALVAIIWTFALSMFDVYVIEAPKKSVEGAAAAGAKGGYAGSFLTGIFAVLVATPCTAPFLGAALGFAFTQTAIIIILIFTSVGLGLGLPFLLLGIWPKAIERLPKPGNWMIVFKEAMGFLLVGTAIYLFTTYAKLAPLTWERALWWLLIVAFSAWILGQARKPTASRWWRITGQILALVLALSTAITVVDWKGQEGGATAQRISGENWIPFEEDDLLSRIEQQEPVFLEFTAAWCTTCKLNQRVIKASEIQQLMKKYKIVHVKADLTAYDATLTRWLADFGRAGVPLYVLYVPGEQPIVFPEILTTDMMKDALNQL
ncbi:MAG: thioredoxin family protein [Spirochaetales bacterium]|nr:thioredoxin family protein [Spirochaetales bacterium]